MHPGHIQGIGDGVFEVGGFRWDHVHNTKYPYIHTEGSGVALLLNIFASVPIVNFRYVRLTN
jgi:hypothetical protein